MLCLHIRDIFLLTDSYFIQGIIIHHYHYLFWLELSQIWPVELIQVDFLFFRHLPIILWVHLYFLVLQNVSVSPCTSSVVLKSVISPKHRSLLLENSIWNQVLGTRYVHRYWGVVASRLYQAWKYMQEYTHISSLAGWLPTQLPVHVKNPKFILRPPVIIPYYCVNSRLLLIPYFSAPFPNKLHFRCLQYIYLLNP